MKIEVLALVFGSLLLAAIGGTFVWLWLFSGSLDTDRSGDGVMQQLMQRKMTAALEIRRGLATRDSRAAERGVDELWRVSEASEWYVSGRRYGDMSGEFRQTLNELDDALTGSDTAPTRERYARMIDCCRDCHVQAGDFQVDWARLQLDGG